MIAAILGGVLEWMQREWPTVVAVGGAMLGLEKWRGQRLANAKLRLENQKLELEVKAMSLALRKQELEKVAQEITGKRLPATDDGPAAFRTMIEEWAKGKAIAEVNAQLDELKDRLAASEEALADFSCPYCGAAVVQRKIIPLGDEHDDEGLAESYECGYATSDLGTTRPCPADPRFPGLDEYELVATQEKSGGWSVWPKPLTSNARRLDLSGGYGRTEEEAIGNLKSQYERYGARRPRSGRP